MLAAAAAPREVTTAAAAGDSEHASGPHADARNRHHRAKGHGSSPAADLTPAGAALADKPFRAVDERSEPSVDCSDSARYALEYGLAHDRALCREQREAYLSVQNKIIARQDKARALLLSANVLSLAVMASQLTMYRWAVTEAQTTAEATAAIMEEVADATRKSYRVARAKARPLRAAARQQGRRRSTRGGPRADNDNDEDGDEDDATVHSKYAAALAAASTAEEREKVLRRLFSRHTRDEQRPPASGSSSHNRSSSNSSSSSSDKSVAGSHCSADGGGPANDTRAPPAPADAVTRLVVVDYFTHESFTDIITHLRYLDSEYGLELVIVLLLPQQQQQQQPSSSSSAAAAAAADAETQGPGAVITPQFDMSVRGAYDSGYDLVITHPIDHIVVDFLTETFVSSVGRWRSDVRARAAVGNYASLRNTLLGNLDEDALRRLVYDVYDVDGDGAAAGQRPARWRREGSADVLSLTDDADDAPAGEGGALAKSRAGSPFSRLPGTLPFTHGQEPLRMGVRSASARSSRGGSASMPLGELAQSTDVLQRVMTPASAVKHSALARPTTTRERGSDAMLVDEAAENQAMYMEAVETEMGRLLADNDSKQASIALLQSEAVRMQKTVTILRRRLCGSLDGAGGGAADGSGGSAEDAALLAADRVFGRPDSASLVNLTKEQQVYILKERLEAANERIAVLMEEAENASVGVGQNASRANQAGRTRSANGRTGSGGAARRTNGVASASDARRQQLQRRRKQQLVLSYHANREGEMLALHDTDAALLGAIAAAEGRDGRAADAGAANAQVQEAERTRERQKTDAAIVALEKELLYLQQQREDDPAEAERRRLCVHSLEGALERLEAQRRRIQQLEELKRMEDAISARRIEQLQYALAAYKERSSPGPLPKPKKTARRRVGGGSGDVGNESVRVERGAATTPGGGETAAAATAAAVAGRAGPKARPKQSEELANMRARLQADHSAQLQKALEGERRYWRGQLREQEARVRALLEELYLRAQRPHTRQYKALRERDRAAAVQEARGAWQRLHYVLGNTPPDAQRDRNEQGKTLTGPLARIADATVRRRALAIAREHAHYTLVAEEAAVEIAQLAHVLEGPAAEEEAADRQALLEQLESQTQTVEEAYVTDADVEQYLVELLALSRVESGLARWATVDCAAVLQRGSTWHDFAAPPAALTPRADGEDTAAVVQARVAACDTEAEAAVVPVQDARRLLSGIAEVFRAATSAAAGGDDPPHARSAGKHGAARDGRRARAHGTTAGESDAAESDSARPSRPSTGPHESRVDGGGAATLTAVERATPSEDVVAHHCELLTALRQSGASHAVVTLYSALQHSYAKGFVRPDSMELVNRHLCLDATVQAREPALTAEAAVMYTRHHRDMQRLWRVLSVALPLLQPVLRLCTTDDALDAEIADELRAASSSSSATRVAATLPLMLAMDAAVAASVADLLTTAAVQTADEAAELDPARGDADAGGTAAQQTLLELSALMREDAVGLTEEAKGRTELLPLPARGPQWNLDSYLRSRPAVVTALRSRLRLLRGGSALTQHSSKHAVEHSVTGGSHGHESELEPGGSMHAGESDEELLQRYAQKYASAGDGRSQAAYTAEDLARMFSNRQRQHDGALTLQDIYLEQADRERGDVLGNDDGDGDDEDTADGAGDDENIAAMRSIRLELEYLNAARRQRLEELALRRRLQQRVRGDDSAAPSYSDSAGGGAGAPAADTSAARREVPGFAVKSGSPAWYGMEAAKRVKDILRRQTRPGQIIVGGGPDGGGVGVELSRRTAFPRAGPAAGEDLLPNGQSHARADASRLPPLRRHGLSRWQQERYYRQTGGAAGADAAEPEGYVHPRDEVSLSAFGNVASHCEFDGVDRFICTPAELTRRVLQYRASVSRAASRLGPTGAVSLMSDQSTPVGARLGPPYYQALLVGNGSERGSTRDAARRPPTERAVLPGVTSWTYGVPEERMRAMLQSTPEPAASDTDGQAAVLFVPQHLRRGVGPDEPLAPSAALSTRAPFLASAAPVGAYTSPAAIAAQQLSDLLRVSMVDPTIGSRLRAGVPSPPPPRVETAGSEWPSASPTPTPPLPPPTD